MLKRPRFCMISIFYPPYSFGGDAVYLYRLVNSLAERGHEVDVVHCIDSYRVSGSKPLEQEFPHHPAVTLHRLRSEEHTSELQSRLHLVCRLLLEKKKKK